MNSSSDLVVMDRCKGLAGLAVEIGDTIPSRYDVWSSKDGAYQPCAGALGGGSAAERSTASAIFNLEGSSWSLGHQLVVSLGP